MMPIKLTRLSQPASPRRWSSSKVRGTPGERGRASGASDRHRVRSAPRPVSQCRPGIDLRPPAAPCVALAAQGHPPVGARLRKEAPPQAGRQCEPPHLHLQRAWGRLPHAQTGQRLRSLPSIAEENRPGASARATQARSACAWRDRPTVIRDCAPATLRGLCRPDERASVPPRLATSSRKSRRRCYRDPGKIP